MPYHNNGKNLGQIELIPGVQEAVNYIKGKVGDFFQLPSRITAGIKKAIQLNEVARAKGKSVQASEALAVKLVFDKARSSYNSLEAKLKTVLDALKSAGLGIIPFIVIGAALALAAGMALLFKTVSFNEKVLSDIENKILTPEEAAGLFGKRPWFGGLLGGLGTPLLLLGGGLLVLLFFTGGRTATRRIG